MTLPAELAGTTEKFKSNWLRARGWLYKRGAWIDPVTSKPHTLGWALRIEGAR